MGLIQTISNFVTHCGQILVIAEVSNEERAFEHGPPWLLTPNHIDSFISCGLTVTTTEIEKDSSGQSKMETYVTAFNKPAAQ